MGSVETQPLNKRRVVARRYLVHRRIGSGGTATVFEAEDQVLRRPVAIKRLRPGGSEDERKRILREARLGASLSHPNLATIYDVIDSDDETLVVMEYVEGEPLSALIPEGGLEPSRVVEVLRPVASALDYAHRHGVVHRDVKPSNIILAADGTAKLVDLGAATSPELTQITTENKVIGTLAYIAPERLSGGDPSGQEADTYSLAATAFEALTGTVPLAAENVAEAVTATLDRPDIRDRLPDASQGLSRTLKRGMDADPSRRQPTAAQLVADIETTTLTPAFTEPPKATAPPPKGTAPPPTAVDGRARTPWLAAGALAAVALATILAIVLAGGGGTPNDATLAGSDHGGKASGNAKSNSAAKRGSDNHAATGGATASTTATTAPATTAPASPLTGAALGSHLNDQGYAMEQGGDYAGAVPVLRRAVAAFPQGTTDINYAYALFNLAHALRMSGDPAAAIPLLEQRLQWGDQTDVVQRELDAARAAAGVAAPKPAKPEPKTAKKEPPGQAKKHEPKPPEGGD
jgi:eukaryotic-like serine/threonine-protein kinase